MEIQLETEARALYNRLYVSQFDLAAARFSVSMLLKKGWHESMPWKRRGTIPDQQTAYTTAFVTAYARPFNKSIGWPKFPVELMPFDQEEQALHGRIIDMRNQVIAHSDSKFYSVTPWRAGKGVAEIIDAPYPHLSAEECRDLLKMISKLHTSVGDKLREMVPYE